MAEPHPIPRHPAFVDLTARTMDSGVHVVHFLGRKLWLAICPCGQEFTAGGAALIKGWTIRCPECRSPSVKPDTKACRGCKRVLPFTAEFFVASKQHPFGLRARCRDCVNAVARIDGREYVRGKRLEILRHYGGNPPECLCCGETAYEFLSLDHLEGGSQEDYREHKNAERYYTSIIRAGFPPRFRVLCHNCNQCCRVLGHCVHAPDRIKFHKSLQLKPDPVLVAPPDVASLPSQACIKCNRLLPLSSEFFSRHRYMTTGLLRMCKDCQRNIQCYHQRSQRRRLKELILAHYSCDPPHCACCSLADPSFLTVDHIHGGGHQERKNNKIHHFYRWVVASGFPPGLQILCWNCNLAKGFYGECPHNRG